MTGRQCGTSGPPFRLFWVISLLASSSFRLWLTFTARPCTAAGSPELLLEPQTLGGAGWAAIPQGGSASPGLTSFTARGTGGNACSLCSERECAGPWLWPSEVISQEVVDQGLLRFHGNLGGKPRLSPRTHIFESLLVPRSSNFLLPQRASHRNVRRSKAVLDVRRGYTFKKHKATQHGFIYQRTALDALLHKSRIKIKFERYKTPRFRLLIYHL